MRWWSTLPYVITTCALGREWLWRGLCDGRHYASMSAVEERCRLACWLGRFPIRAFQMSSSVAEVSVAYIHSLVSISMSFGRRQIWYNNACEIDQGFRIELSTLGSRHSGTLGIALLHGVRTLHSRRSPSRIFEHHTTLVPKPSGAPTRVGGRPNLAPMHTSALPPSMGVGSVCVCVCVCVCPSL